MVIWLRAYVSLGIKGEEAESNCTVSTQNPKRKTSCIMMVNIQQPIQPNPEQTLSIILCYYKIQTQ
jgi:hypothetical protein